MSTLKGIKMHYNGDMGQSNFVNQNNHGKLFKGQIVAVGKVLLIRHRPNIT